MLFCFALCLLPRRFIKSKTRAAVLYGFASGMLTAAVCFGAAPVTLDRFGLFRGLPLFICYMLMLYAACRRVFPDEGDEKHLLTRLCALGGFMLGAVILSWM